MGKKSLFLVLLLLLSVSYGNFGSKQLITDDAFNDPMIIQSDSGTNSDLLQSELSGYQDLIDNNPTYAVETTAISDAIKTSSITSEVHTPGRDSYIVDFGFHQLFTYSASQVVKDNAAAYLEFQETAQFSVDLTIPVNLTLNYLNTIEAGKSTNVEVDLFKVEGGASFGISYGFTLGGDYRIGPVGEIESFELFNYTNTRNFAQFEVPLDPVPLTKWGVDLPLNLIPGIGTVISSLFAIDLVLSPQLDVDIVADLFFEGEGNTNIETLVFNTAEKQSFNLNVDAAELGGAGIKFGLENFSMDFILSLLWGLEVEFAGLLSFLNFLGPLKIKLFTYPNLPLAGLSLGDQAFGLVDVTPTTNLPEFSVDTILNDDNGIIQPDETVSISAIIENIGNGPAFQTNISVSSPNVTISSGNTNNFLFPIRNEEFVNHDIGFTVPLSYSGRNLTIDLVLDTISANNTLITEIHELVFRVLQTNDAYLKIDRIDVFEPQDGFWDGGESVRLDIDLSKIGSADIEYGYIEVLATTPSGFSSNNTWTDTPVQTFTTWNATGIYLDAPLDILTYEVDLFILVSYDLTSGQIYNDIWVYSLPIYPLDAIEDLDTISATLVDGTDDGIFTAGETFLVDADISNIGTDDSGVVVGYLYTDDVDVVIENEFLFWDNHSPFTGSVASNNVIEMTISPNAENQTLVLTLVLFHETWWGEISFDVHEITMDIVQQKDPVVSLNYYEIYDESLSVSNLQPGETSLITVDISVTEGPAFSVFGNLYSDNDQVLIVNDTSFYGDLEAGGLSSEGDGFIVHVPANFEGGTVTFVANITSENAVGDLVWEAAYFEVTISAGDTQVPTFTLNAPSSANESDEVTVSAEYSDNVGIGDVYFAYFNYDIDDWEIQSFEGEGTTGFEFTFTMSDQPFLYAFIIFDVSGNYAGGGLNDPLQIDSDDPNQSDPDNPPDDDTPPGNNAPKASDSDDSPLSLLFVLIGIIFAPLVFRRPLKYKLKIIS